MAEIKDFYESGRGDRLIDPFLFPEEIKQFLLCEKRILEALAGSFNLLVEVGSMYGRYLKWAVENGKRYFGIDVVGEKGDVSLLNREFGFLGKWCYY